MITNSKVVFAGLIGAVTMTTAQTTYENDIAPIINKHCVSCHKPGGYGPFSLESFSDVQKRAKFIGYVTQTRYMPPWKADPSFSHFANERYLSEDEIATIQRWISEGLIRGDAVSESLAVEGEADNEENQVADLVLKMAKPFELSTDGIEDYRFFHVPTGLKEDVYVSRIEFIAGNKRYLHHSRVMVDTSGQTAGIDGLSEFDPLSRSFQTQPLMDEFLYGWVPGNLPVTFPKGVAKLIPANSDLIFNIHYAPSAEKVSDLSGVKFYFSKDPVDHLIKSFYMEEEDISNPPFIIKANEKPTFYVSKTISQDMTVVSLLPHMHFLGKKMVALAITPDNREIPLIRINDWDFNWQSTYLLQEPLFLPKGTVLLLVAEYDNTSDNQLNPTNPPRDVTYGWNSTDEMMNLIFYYY